MRFFRVSLEVFGTARVCLFSLFPCEKARSGDLRFWVGLGWLCSKWWPPIDLRYSSKKIDLLVPWIFSDGPGEISAVF